MHLFSFGGAAYLGTSEKYFQARMRKKTAAAAIMNVEINLRTKARNAEVFSNANNIGVRSHLDPVDKESLAPEEVLCL